MTERDDFRATDNDNEIIRVVVLNHGILDRVGTIQLGASHEQYGFQHSQPVIQSRLEFFTEHSVYTQYGAYESCMVCEAPAGADVRYACPERSCLRSP
jgi:hypothetical protein